MQNRRQTIFALLLALLAALFAMRHLQAVATERIVGSQSGRAIVTVTSIPKGTKITAHMFAYIPISEELIPTNAVVDAGAILGRSAACNLGKGALLLEEHLISGRTLAERLEGNLYGFTLAVDERNSIAGLLRPGDHVDVVSIIAGRTLTGATSVTVLRQVPVMAVGGALDEYQGTGRTTVTLGLSLTQAQMLALFEEYSTLRLVLCSKFEVDGTGLIEPTELEQVLSQRGIVLKDDSLTGGAEWSSLLQGVGWPDNSSSSAGIPAPDGEVIRGTTVEKRDLN